MSILANQILIAIEVDMQEAEDSLFSFVFGKRRKPEIDKPEAIAAAEKNRRTFRWRAWSYSIAFTMIMMIILFVVIYFNINKNL